jgi:hypothetical protein
MCVCVCVCVCVCRLASNKTIGAASAQAAVKSLTNQIEGASDLEQGSAEYNSMVSDFHTCNITIHSFAYRSPLTHSVMRAHVMCSLAECD